MVFSFQVLITPDTFIRRILTNDQYVGCLNTSCKHTTSLARNPMGVFCTSFALIESYLREFKRNMLLFYNSIFCNLSGNKCNAAKTLPGNLSVAYPQQLIIY